MAKILVVEDERVTRHLLSSILKEAGFTVATARDGNAALKEIGRRKFDLVLLDIWLPGMNGIEVLARLRERKRLPRVIVMTSDDAPETLLSVVREQAYNCANKPVSPKELLKLVRDALTAPPSIPPIEVLSARPNWVELLVPCDLGAAERIQNFLSKLKTDLPPDVRETVGRVFRELLLNAIEWGGRLDPNRKVRISYLRAQRMLLYRIADPGEGFRFDDIPHAAVSHGPDQPIAHVAVREEKGIRPGGFGILMAKTMVDELIYNEVQNEVVFVKYLD